MTTQKRAPRLDLNPSSADRWTTCTASPQYIMDNWDQIPPSSTKFSEEGTTAHEIAAAMLQDRPPRLDDPQVCPVPAKPEMYGHAWNYMEYVEGLKNSPQSRLLVEQKLPLWYMPGRNAIVDAAVINPDSLHVVDYKYGEGVIVSPEQSLQATIYARSVGSSVPSLTTGDFPIFIHIYQPRGRAAADVPFHVWETTWGEISKLAGDINEIAQYIQDPGSPPEIIKFKPSEKACQFCPAKGFCTERPKMLTKGIEALQVIETGPKHLPPVKAVSLAQLAAIVEHGENIIKWINDAKAYALDYMKAGNKLPGSKLVMSRGGNRYWTDEKQAAALLLSTTILKREEVIEESVIGPAAAEKLLGKHKFNTELTNLIGKPPGHPVIAREDDKREPALLDGKSEFEVITE